MTLSWPAVEQPHRKLALRSNFAAVVVVWAIVLLYLAPLFNGQVPWNQDVALYFLPFKVAGIALIRAGHLPLWSSLPGLGYPLLADGQAGLLYPPDLALFLLLPPASAFDVGIIAHALLGSTLAYVFFRRLALRPAAAALGAIVFALAGPILPLTGTPRLAAAAWWPGLLIVADAMIVAHPKQHASAPHVAVGSVVVALTLAAGYPQVAAEGLLLMVAFGTYRAWVSVEGTSTVFRHIWSTITRVAPLLLSIVLGAGLAAPQLFATLELASQSVRAGGAGQLAAEGSLFPPALVELVAPNWNFAATLGDESPRLFVGTLALAFATLAIVRRRPGTRFWAGVAFATVLLAFGRFTPLFWLITHLPGLSYFRVPARFLYLTTTALAALAAIGFDTLLRAKDHRNPAAFLVRTGLGLFLCAISVEIVSAGALRFFVEQIYERVVRSASVAAAGGNVETSRLVAAGLAATSPSNPQLWPPVLGFISLMLISTVLRRGLVTLATVLTLASAVGELWLVASSVGPVVVLQPPATVSAVDSLSPGSRLYSFGEPYRTASEGRYDLLPANLSAQYGQANIGLYAALGDPLYRSMLEPLGAVDLAFGAAAPTTDGLRQNRRLLDLVGASTVVSPIPLDGFELTARVGDVYLYTNSDAFPRAWVVDQVQAVDQVNRADLLSPSLNLHRVALVESITSLPDLTTARVGKADVVAEDGESLVLSGEGPGVLVVADRWAPGWRATIDGSPAPIWKVDGILRGVPLPAGAHRVELTYRSEGFWWGVRVAAVSLVVLVAYWVLELRRRRLLVRHTDD